MNVNQMAGLANVWGWVQIDGFEMYLAGNDCGVCLKSLYGQPYEPQSLALWSDLCGSKGTAIDVGAHTGVYTLTAMTKGNPVVSIEPYALNYARLSVNVRKNGFTDAGLFYGAAGAADGLAALSINTNKSYCTSGGVIDEEFKGLPVRVVRLDSLVADVVSVIKIDVEGKARDVLLGAAHILENDKPDLLIECTEDGLTEILAPLGYKFFVVNESTGLEPCNDLRPIPAGKGWDMNRLNRYCTVKA